MKHLRRFKSLLALFAVLLLVALALPSALAGTPTGVSPNDPLMVTGAWQAIAPDTSLWFYFDYARAGWRNPKAEVALDANGVGNLQLAIYTPDQARAWLQDRTTAPVGYGTPLRDLKEGFIVHDLYWSGGFNRDDRYYAVVTNNNPTPVQFLLTITGYEGVVSLAPPPTPTPTPTLPIPITTTPVLTATIQGKFVFQDAVGGTIYTVSGNDSTLIAVSHGIDPAWSPDGKQIVFARWDNPSPGVYIANADGSDERIVFGAPRVRSPRWSPDGTQIVFSLQKKETPQPVWKLGVVDIATGKLTEPQCTRLCFVPTWSNDGRTIAYTDPGTGIMATDKTSGAPWIVLGPSGYYFNTAKDVALPIEHLPPTQSSAWSPDGSQIAFMLRAHDRWEINLVNASGGEAIGVTRPDPILYVLFGIVVHNAAPTWSPDGKQILFLSDCNGKWEFFVINPDGSNLRQVLKSVTDWVTIQYSFENERVIDWAK